MKRGRGAFRTSGWAQFLRTGRVREDAHSVWGRRRKVSAVLLLALAVVVPVVPALAAADVGVLIEFPTTFSAGQTRTASYRVLNISTGAEAAGTMTVTEMTLIPSCSTFDPGCDAPGSVADPGTFDFAATGTGAADTACEGRVFNIVETNPATGEVSFVPADGQPLVLGPQSEIDDLDTCRIEFSVTAVRAPNHDTLPADAGASTNLLAAVSAVHQNGTPVTTSNDDIATVTDAVGPVTPTVTTTASPGVALGGQVTDTALLAGGSNPTGTIIFSLYGPDDAACAGPIAFQSSKPVTGNGSYQSDAFTPTAPGVYRWVAVYSGDAGHNQAVSPCNAPNESVTVSSGPAKATPALATTASPGVQLGGQVTDTAALSGGASPTGTITFTLFGPDNPGCTGAPVFTNTKPVSGNGTYTSDPFTPVSAGVYRWVAAYSGDAGNNPVTSPCNAAGESVTVSPTGGGITVTLTTQVNPATASLGQPVTDTATIAGGTNPTGSITFRAFGPGNAGCTGAPVYSNTVPVSGNGSYSTSVPFVPTAAGQYRFIASYTGDATHSPVSGACNDPNELVNVTTSIGSLAVTKTASPSTLPAPGGTFTFSVQISNTGLAPQVVTSITDNVHGNLATLGGANTCDDLIGATISPEVSLPTCSFQAAFTGAAGASETDIVTVTAVDDSGFQSTASDDATVTITAPSQPETPSISVEVTPTPGTVDEPGGRVTYRVVITNTSNPIALTIVSITDSVLGDVAGLPEPNTCDSLIGTTLQQGQSVTCEFSVQVTGDADQDRSSFVTVAALASTGQTVSDTSPAVTVEVRDVIPRIEVEKEASPESRSEPGGRFTFRIEITNLEDEAVVLTVLGDDQYGDLDGDGTCDTGVTIAANGSYSCEFSVQFTGEDGDRQTDTVVATVVDDEGNTATGRDSATIRITDPVGAVATPTPTATPTPGPTPTATPTPAPTAGPTASPAVTATPGATPSPPASPPGPLSRTGLDALGWLALAFALLAAGALLRQSPARRRRS